MADPALAAKLASMSKRAAGGCRIWRTGPDRHAFLRWRGEVRLASNWVWEQAHGPLAPEVRLYKRCGVRGCIALAHLVAGPARGNPQLPEDTVRAIIFEAPAATATALARRHGVDRRTVARILKRARLQ